MILYKYMSANAAITILAKNSIGFAKPDTFNDPYELKAAYPPKGDSPLDYFIAEIQSRAKQSILSDTSGVLCLTRNPLNALMWAHYGDEHRGVVLGIDVEKAGFMDMQSCLVPAQFGSMVYTYTRPTHALPIRTGIDPISLGRTHHYPLGHEEKLQRTFLQKPSCWAYEEEVRVVKCLSDRKNGTNQSGTFDEVDLQNKTLYCFNLPAGAIREVYFGMRHPFFMSLDSLRDGLRSYLLMSPNISVYGCRLSSHTWDIDSYDIKNMVSQN